MADKKNRKEEALKRKQEEKKILAEIAFAQDELNQLKKEHGIEDEEKGLKKFITKSFERRENRVKTLISKKIYIILLLFFGVLGIHRFYAKQYPTAILYLLFCWTGLSITMSVIDLMVVIPMQKDENGKILI